MDEDEQGKRGVEYFTAAVAQWPGAANQRSSTAATVNPQRLRASLILVVSLSYGNSSPLAESP